MSTDKLRVVKDYIDIEATKGTIEKSNSRAASLVLIISKPRGSLRVYVNYRGVNKGTIKDRYPIPLIKETLGRL